MAMFDSGFTNVSILIDVPFPSNVVSGPGVQINKTSSVWSVNLDFPDLTDGGTPATPSNVFLAGYDTGLLQYQKLRLDNVIAGATGLDVRTPRGDANYSILITDRYIALTAALTAVRTWTLPAANTVPGGRVVTIQDEAGGISGTNFLTFAPTGADTLNGAPSFLLKTKNGGVSFRSNGSNAWNVITLAATQVATPRTAGGDANYTILSTDIVVVTGVALTAPRTYTLPLAASVGAGRGIFIGDDIGTLTATNFLAVARSGADTINGGTGASLVAANQGRWFYSDGVAGWYTPQPTGRFNGFAIGDVTPATGAFTTLNATSFSIGASTLALNGSATITPQVGGLAGWSAGTIAAAAPRIFRGYDTATNLQINATVAANALTIAIKGEDGNDPSAQNPVYIPFRDATIANGDLSFLTLSAATSIVAAAGASFGSSNGLPFRLWIVGFNDAGTFRLGLINCLTAGPPLTIYPLRAKSNDVVSSLLISAGATTSQVHYTSGAGVTTKSFQILGYAEWSAGLATAGTYASGPTKLQLFGPSVALPGDTIGNPVTNSPNTSGGTTTSTTMVDVTNSNLAITLTSACNVVRYDYAWNCSVAAGGAGVNTSYIGQLVRGAGPTLLWGAGTVGVTSGAGTNMQSQGSMSATGLDPLQSTTATTYKLQNRTTNAAGAAQTQLINGMVQEVMV